MIEIIIVTNGKSSVTVLLPAVPRQGDVVQVGGTVRYRINSPAIWDDITKAVTMSGVYLPLDKPPMVVV